MQGQVLQVVSCYKYLGIWLDDCLSFKLHVTNLLKKLRVRRGFSFEARKRLCDLWPVLDHGDLIYINAPAHCLERLDAAYHSALRCVTNCKALTHHCTLYAKAGLPSLTGRRLSHWYMFIYKAMLGNYQLIYALWSHREWQVAIAWDPRMCSYYMCQVLGLLRCSSSLEHYAKNIETEHFDSLASF